TWWVNRKDSEGNHHFGGGFLGLDNVGVFDRSRPLPGGGTLEQADGTAWMGFYCVTLLEMALELAREDPACEDMASKFFEHFIAIADAMNAFGGSGLWSPDDGFYYDQLLTNGRVVPLRVLSMVHRERPFVLTVDGQEYEVHYTPAESDTGLFGGNSNWRGPVWFPLNYLLAEALERYHHFYGDDLRVECPTGSGRLMNLREV